MIERIAKIKTEWGSAEYYQETSSRHDWEKRLRAAEKNEGPAPMPKGHHMFRYPEQYKAVIVNEFGA